MTPRGSFQHSQPTKGIYRPTRTDPQPPLGLLLFPRLGANLLASIPVAAASKPILPPFLPCGKLPPPPHPHPWPMASRERLALWRWDVPGLYLKATAGQHAQREQCQVGFLDGPPGLNLTFDLPLFADGASLTVVTPDHRKHIFATKSLGRPTGTSDEQ